MHALQVVVDALPYLDKEYDKPAMRDLVDRWLHIYITWCCPFPCHVAVKVLSWVCHHDVLATARFCLIGALGLPCWADHSMIDEEMDQFDAEDYISSLPPVPQPSFAEGSILAQEYERVVSDPSSRLSAVDASRYQPRAPRSITIYSPCPNTRTHAHPQTRIMSLTPIKFHVRICICTSIDTCLSYSNVCLRVCTAGLYAAEMPSACLPVYTPWQIDLNPSLILLSLPLQWQRCRKGRGMGRCCEESTNVAGAHRASLAE
jgi:hypothetical protein